MTYHASLLSRLAMAVAHEAESYPLAMRVCRATRELLGADGASITIENSTPHRVTLCATDRPATLLENLQDVLGEGPCRDAFDLDRPVETGLGGAAVSRWPQFVPAAEKVIGPDGILWSIPMRAAERVIGAVSLYRRLAGPLVEPMDAAQFLADAAASTLIRDPLAFAAVTRPGEGGGWSSRAVVHQATGMLVGMLRISVDDALAVLRSYAFSTGTELIEVATAVVERSLDLSGEQPS
ncbi:MAG: GAF and ANTAR domain-containing protein [Actinomycetota bacterium]